VSRSSPPDMEAADFPFHLLDGGMPFSYTYHRLPDHVSTYQGTLLDATCDHLIIAQQIRSRAPFLVEGQTVLEDGSWALWFLLKGRSYDVARFYRSNGEWMGYYVDTLEGTRWDGADPATLQPLIDHFLDLWIGRDGRVVVLDEDELLAAEHAGVIGIDNARTARHTVTTLRMDVERGAFPPPLVRHFPSPPV
jgi:uncharacterized protein